MSLQLPNLNGLRAFEASGRHQNFRAAADALGVTQGAVAQHVRALEGQLGQKLFERKSKGLAFTPAGRAYHGHISEAFALIAKASEALRPNIHRVTISVTPTFASKWLIPNLPDLSTRHPEIDLRVLATENVSSFHSDGIDLAVRQGKMSTTASIDSHYLFSNEIIAVAAPSILGDIPLPMSAQRLASFPKLHDGHDLWSRFLSAMGVANTSERGTRVNQTALAIDAAIAGQGAALASRFLVERDIESGRLVEISSQTISSVADFHLLSRKGSQISPAVKQVVQWLLGKAA